MIMVWRRALQVRSKRLASPDDVKNGEDPMLTRHSTLDGGTLQQFVRPDTKGLVKRVMFETNMKYFYCRKI